MAEISIDEVAGATLSHSSLFVTLLGVMKARGLITQTDVNEIIDLALVSLEQADMPHKEAQRHGREMLEETARIMGDPVRPDARAARRRLSGG